MASSLILEHLAVTIFRHNFFVFRAMAAKLCKEQQISFGNSTKYSDVIDGKYFLRNKRLKGPYYSKKIASSKKIC